MQLGEKAKAIVAFGIAVAVIIFAGLVANAALNQDTVAEHETKLDKALKSADAQDLSVTAVALADIYGMDYVEAITVCAGMPLNELEQIGVPTEKMRLSGETVPRGVNYIAMAKQDGTVDLDRFEVEKVNLCPQGQVAQILPQGLMPFVKDTQSDAWLFAGGVQ